MASYGIISGTCTNRATIYTPKVYWKQVSQSIENNTTTVRVYSFVQSTSLSYDWNGPCSSWTMTVNGVTRTLASFTSNTDSGWTYLNGWTDGSTVVSSVRTELIPETGVIYQDFTITHNADGTKSVSLSHSYSLNSGGYGPGNVSVSGTLDLNTIPRASQPTVNDSTVTIRDQTVTISTNPASGSFTHTILYSFGTASGTIASGVAASTTWTPPIALSSQIPNTESGTATITCHTYSGATLVGTKTVDITLSIPTNVIPTASIAVAGVDLYSGYYVQNKSKVTVTLTSAGVYGSTITGRATTVNGATYTTASFTTGALTAALANAISATVTDSRGRKGTAASSVSVVAYSNPQATTLTAIRSNSDGSANPQGAYMKLTGSAVISPINSLNTKSTIVRYRITGGTWATAVTNTASYTPALTATVAANVNNTYEAELVVTDAYTSTTKAVAVSTAFVLMDFHSSGNSMAIGKVAEANGVLEVKGASYFDGSVILDGSAINGNFLVNKGNAPTDLHTITDNGIWSISGVYTNFYTTLSMYGTLVSTRRAAGASTYIQLTYYDANAHTIAVNQNWGGVWRGWFPVWTAGNDGPGSGLDADVVDGLHAASFEKVTSYGTNANGWYQKFDNGVMMCWQVLYVGTGMSVTTAYGSLFKGEYTWTFPAAFISGPCVPAPQTSYRIYDAGNLITGWSAVGVVDTTYAKFIAFDVVSRAAGGAMPFRGFAIGRWKA